MFALLGGFLVARQADDLVLMLAREVAVQSDDPSGQRMSWITRSKSVRVQDPTSRTREALAVASSGGGAFTVEQRTRTTTTTHDRSNPDLSRELRERMQHQRTPNI